MKSKSIVGQVLLGVLIAANVYAEVPVRSETSDRNLQKNRHHEDSNGGAQNAPREMPVKPGVGVPPKPMPVPLTPVTTLSGTPAASPALLNAQPLMLKPVPVTVAPLPAPLPIVQLVAPPAAVQIAPISQIVIQPIELPKIQPISVIPPVITADPTGTTSSAGSTPPLASTTVLTLVSLPAGPSTGTGGTTTPVATAPIVLSNTALISTVGTTGGAGATGTSGSIGTTGTTGIVGTTGTTTTLTLTSQTPVLAAGTTTPVISTVPTTYVLRPTTIKVSDRRLKTNIERIGTHRLGIGIYKFDYVWGEHAVGVMADEVKTVMPEAVVRGSDGYDRVDYSRLNQ